ncbi:Lipopolysaccharide heptosyltransferase II [Thiomonas sp. X19]|uniref:lipopolysaccharide heptosyltransferase II n=1 Tax=Thiomonas sp. X19 TaxID=1050370 RepID=UPI000B693DEF|nr:lipopolysaccharide heptosyltransferase II [Thiomonas sp. X19]SCC92865.1 Lipopolysaccharide heptosyltransferase II [Thiomonas sp. X19]
MTRVLLIAPQWIGDAVMAQPLVALLAARGEQVTALGLPGVAPVLRAMPGVVDVIEAPFAHGKLDFPARRRLAAQLRERGYERAYILGNNVKSRLVPWLARIPQRIGYRGEARGLLLTHAAHAPDSAHASSATHPVEPLAISPIAGRIPREAAASKLANAGQAGASRSDMRRHYAALAACAQPGAATAGAASAAATSPAPILEPTLHIAASMAAAARQRFGLPERWVALCPGAEYGPAKQWPVEHYAALARLAQQQGYTVAVLGAPRDAAMGEAIATQAAGSVNLCGKTRVEQVIALLASSQGAVSNDSGLMHVAAALGRATVGLYGSTDPRHTPPAAHRSATIWLQLDCSPCFQRTCPLGHLNCLRGITPEQTWAQLRGLMQGP